MLQLRRERFDYAILAGAGLRHKGLQLARQLGIKHIIGYTEADKALSKHIDMGVPYVQTLAQHEVENTHKLLSVLNIHDAPPALTVIADSYKIAEANAKLKHALPSRTVKKPIGVHISARLPSNRWVEGYYIELIRKLWERHQQPVLLFWSPGDENNALHPGDDQKAARIVQALNNIPVLPFATHELAELIAGLSLCKILICSDGGAMHVAAGLKKPLVCFFGETEIKHWYPWKVPHKILQPESGKVADVTVDEAFEAFESLLTEYQHEIAHHD
jgi:ADP-heptose:LPS heptosyltransferase